MTKVLFTLIYIYFTARARRGWTRCHFVVLALPTVKVNTCTLSDISLPKFAAFEIYIYFAIIQKLYKSYMKVKSEILHACMLDMCL